MSEKSCERGKVSEKSCERGTVSEKLIKGLGDQRVKIIAAAHIPANTGHSPNAVSMLGQRRRRRVNIDTALGECTVFAGK